jgi:hypothetical protein
MAQPAQRTPNQRTPEELPSLDPRAVEHAYHRERARRRARAAHRSETRRSHLRFCVVLTALAFASAFALLLVWELVQTLFGV